MAVAEEEGDAQEVTEFAATARQWMTQVHEEKLADKGVQAPPVPEGRAKAAEALYQSLTMKQVEKLAEILGKEKSEMLIGMLGNAADMDDEQVATMFGTVFTKMEDQVKLMGTIEEVFSVEYVPSSWAIWQVRCATVVIDGKKDKAA